MEVLMNLIEQLKKDGSVGFSLSTEVLDLMMLNFFFKQQWPTQGLELALSTTPLGELTEPDPITGYERVLIQDEDIIVENGVGYNVNILEFSGIRQTIGDVYYVALMEGDFIIAYNEVAQGGEPIYVGIGDNVTAYPEDLAISLEQK